MERLVYLRASQKAACTATLPAFKISLAELVLSQRKSLAKINVSFSEKYDPVTLPPRVSLSQHASKSQNGGGGSGFAQTSEKHLLVFR